MKLLGYTGKFLCGICAIIMLLWQGGYNNNSFVIYSEGLPMITLLLLFISILLFVAFGFTDIIFEIVRLKRSGQSYSKVILLYKYKILFSCFIPFLTGLLMFVISYIYWIVSYFGDTLTVWFQNVVMMTTATAIGLILTVFMGAVATSLIIQIERKQNAII